MNDQFDVGADPDWDNALLLSITVDQNRRLVKELLREIATLGHADSMMKHPMNRRFINQMKAMGKNTELLLNGHRIKKRLGKEKIIIYTELNPLKILQMGNLFNTCLSVGREMSYSTIANALEVNKKVIYRQNG